MIRVRGNQVYLGSRRLGIVYPSKKTFRTFRRSSKHLFRAYNGWGINKELLEYLEKMGVEWIEVEDLETGKIYRANIATIEARGISHDYNGERQKILPLPYWLTHEYRSTLMDWMGGEAA